MTTYENNNIKAVDYRVCLRCTCGRILSADAFTRGNEQVLMARDSWWQWECRDCGHLWWIRGIRIKGCDLWMFKEPTPGEVIERMAERAEEGP